MMQTDGVNLEDLRKKYPDSDLTVVKIKLGCDNDDDEDCEKKPKTLPGGIVLPKHDHSEAADVSQEEDDSEDIEISEDNSEEDSEDTEVSEETDDSPCDPEGDDDCDEVTSTSPFCRPWLHEVYSPFKSELSQGLISCTASICIVKMAYGGCLLRGSSLPGATCKRVLPDKNGLRHYHYPGAIPHNQAL